MDLDRPFRGSEAIAAGLTTRRRLRGPCFTELGRDTYVRAGVALDDLGRILAASLEVPGAVVGGWAAVIVLGVDAAPEDVVVELVVGRRRITPRPGIALRQDVLGGRESFVVDGLRVTTPERTAFDLARRPDHVEAVVALDALAHAYEFAVEEVLAYPANRDNPRDGRRLEAVVADADARAASPPETRTRLVLRGGGVPEPVPQYQVLDARGRRVGRVDFGWPALRIALEYQGDHHRTDRRQWRRDAVRTTELAAAGWLVLPVTAHDLFVDPAGLVRRVLAALERRARELGVPFG